MDVSRAADNAKGVEQPDDDADDYHDVENIFNLSIHGDVAIDQPEQHADDDQGYDERD
jgi:hypothetical protein